MILALATLGLAAPHVMALSTADYAVQLTATVSTNPPSVRLNWVPSSYALSYTLYRKAPSASSWGTAVTTLTNKTASSYVDSAVTNGTAYEYRIDKSAKDNSTSYNGYGYITVAVDTPAVEAQGKVILVVDQTYAAELSNELARLEMDLVGDGWTVLRHNVARTASVVSVKGLIKADYLADTGQVNTVFLFGHVPVPYSGDIYPDGHGNHRGAWPADGFYADMDGTWTDTTVSNAANANKNVPGDGRYDQGYMPSGAELQVGRVDLASMPAFPNNERELLRQYLAKDHNYRHGYFAPAQTSLIDDEFGTASGEAFAASAWSSLPPLVGSSKIISANFTTLATNRCVWAYGCGGGTYTSANGVDSTSTMAGGRRQAVFTMLFGSYFGDWDNSDNFLRAPLASVPSALTCVWSGRPMWVFHPMGIGLPIGYCARLMQNVSNTYVYEMYYGGGGVHVALMGDPTLRLNPVPPPSALTLSVDGTNVTLGWTASPDAAISGYHVYRADAAGSAYARLTETPVTNTWWNDVPARATDIGYMVRAVKRVTTPSGIFTDLSQGSFNRLAPDDAINTPPAPVAGFTLATNEDMTIPFALSGTDPEGNPVFCTIRAFPAGGRLIGSPTNMVYRPNTNWYGTDTFVYYASDGLVDGAAATVTVTIAAVNDPPVPTNITQTVTNNRAAAITLSATDVENNPITYVLISSPTNGTLTGTPPSLAYTATDCPSGKDVFRYTAFDGTDTRTGTVTLTIVDMIVARSDTATTPEDTPVLIDVLANDTDPNGYTLYVSGSSSASTGSVSATRSNVTYRPPTNWSGTANFRYNVTNALLGQSSAAVTVTVTAVNDAPRAQNQTVRVLTDHSKAIVLQATDVETNVLTFAADAPLHGVLTGDGPDVTYTPETNYFGPDEFTFRASDGLLWGTTGRVTLTVVPLTYRAASVSHLTAGVYYAYAVGPFTSLAQAEAAPASEEGLAYGGLNIDVRSQHTNFAFRWEGYLSIPADGEYTFEMSACRQAQFSLWGVPLFATNPPPNGVYQNETTTNLIALGAGLHPFTATYYMGTNTTRFPYISLFYSSDDGSLPSTYVDEAVLCRGTMAAGGTPVDWLRHAIGSSLDYDALEQTDSDGDGQANWAEYLAGTDPSQRQSVFSIINAGSDGHGGWISWYATTNSGATNLMAVERNTNLTFNSWETVWSNGVRAADGTNTWVDPVPPGNGPVFYRPVILP